MSVMVLGFTATECQKFLAQGVDTQVAIYTGKQTPANIPKTIPYKQLLEMPREQGFASSLDKKTATEIRRVAFPYFRRTYYRLFNRAHPSDTSWLDIENHFEAGMQYLWNQLYNHSIDTVIFNNIPHIGSSITLYYMCKLLGIRTIVGAPFHFVDFMWISENIEDIGIDGFRTDPIAPLEVQENLVRPHFIKPYKKRSPIWLVTALAKRVLSLTLKTLALPFTRDVKNAQKSKLKLRDIVREYRLHNLPSAWMATPDLNSQYIYFPLHLQPEMTTDINGGIYCDQILAIEELARALPDNIRIYVKENPFQTKYMRDASFYDRLLAIPQVDITPINFDSFTLIENAVGVASICGTAGWEALQMDKPTITFGYAWYRDLPGAYQWKADGKETVNDFLNFSPDHEKLKAAVNDKRSLLWNALINPVYIGKIPKDKRSEMTQKKIDVYVSALKAGSYSKTM